MHSSASGCRPCQRAQFKTQRLKTPTRPKSNNHFATGGLVTINKTLPASETIHTLPSIRDVNLSDGVSVINRGSSLNGTSPNVLDRGKSIRSPSWHFTSPSPTTNQLKRSRTASRCYVVIQRIQSEFSSARTCSILFLTAQGAGFYVSRWGTWPS